MGNAQGLPAGATEWACCGCRRTSRSPTRKRCRGIFCRHKRCSKCTAIVPPPHEEEGTIPETFTSKSPSSSKLREPPGDGYSLDSVDKCFSVAPSTTPPTTNATNIPSTAATTTATISIPIRATTKTPSTTAASAPIINATTTAATSTPTSTPATSTRPIAATPSANTSSITGATAAPSAISRTVTHQPPTPRINDEVSAKTRCAPSRISGAQYQENVTDSCSSTTEDISLPCLTPNCTRRFSQKVDVEKHMKEVHAAPPDLIDCTYSGCTRKGKSGFERQDHLTEHLQNHHEKHASRKEPQTSQVLKETSVQEEPIRYTCTASNCTSHIFSRREDLETHMKTHSRSDSAKPATFSYGGIPIQAQSYYNPPRERVSFAPSDGNWAEYGYPQYSTGSQPSIYYDDRDDFYFSPRMAIQSSSSGVSNDSDFESGPWGLSSMTFSPTATSASTGRSAIYGQESYWGRRAAGMTSPTQYYPSHRTIGFDSSFNSPLSECSSSSADTSFLDYSSPVSPQISSPVKPNFPCLVPGCTSKGQFRRKADLERHMKTHDPNPVLLDCTFSKCGRKGTSGFSRRDHLVEHLRDFHKQNIPRKGEPGYRRHGELLTQVRSI